MKYAILTTIFCLLILAGKSQSNYKRELNYQKNTGIGLLITGGAFAHMSAAMYYGAATSTKESRYTHTDYVCAGTVFLATALPCLIVGSVNLGRYNKNIGLTFKTTGNSCTALLTF